MVTATGFQSLQASYQSFLAGRSEEGYAHFQQASRTSQGVEAGIYGKMWEIKHKPVGNSEFGRQCFHNASGLTSTPEERAQAVAAYMISKGVQPATAVPLTSRTVTSQQDFDRECQELMSGAAIAGGVAAIGLAIAGAALGLSALDHALHPDRDRSMDVVAIREWGAGGW